MSRAEKLAGLVRPLEQEGIEIGALDRPLFSGPGIRLRIADYLSSEQLKAKYETITAIDLERIAHVDYVLSGRSLPEAVGPKRFDYAIASHVIEHVPNFVGFLSEVSSILKPGGLLCLAIPDKRYSFDFTRPTTTLAEVIEAHLGNFVQPSPRQVFDHFSNHVNLDLKEAWTRSVPENELPKSHSLKESLSNTQASLMGTYHDVHSQVFTPNSFCEVMEGLMELELIDFEFADYHPTELWQLEFFVTLKRSSYSNLEERKKHQVASIPRLLLADNVPRNETEENSRSFLIASVTQGFEGKVFFVRGAKRTWVISPEWAKDAGFRWPQDIHWISDDEIAIYRISDEALPDPSIIERARVQQNNSSHRS